MSGHHNPTRGHITRATDALTAVTHGPMAIARGCRLCSFVDCRPRGRGRGAGFREGNKQRGRVHQHMNAEHPNALTAVVQILAVDGWQSIPPRLPISDLKKLDQPLADSTKRGT